MFCWYRKATRCYAYLPDVSTTSFTSNRSKKSTTQREPAFWKSRWFKWGWTLQELLAPASVEFFSLEGRRLGDKSSLGQQLHEITAIPVSALQGAPLSQFSVNERISWINNRQTKLEEDKAYSLLGILDVHIPPIYGEGMESAFRRLREEIGKQKKCMQDLHLTDPRNDKKRIEDTKGGLLEDSYHWILENADFRQWRDDKNSRLLWIKGDPGKGKTMLLCGIINELKKSIAKTDLLSYFSCQTTDSRINSATAVLRGLLYLLIKQQPSLILHIQKEHDHTGKSLFENANTWVALSEIFTSILGDLSLDNTFLVVDVLDECVIDMPKLLDFVAQKSGVSSLVKWVVSSRNWPVIEKALEPAIQKVKLCLELHEDSVSTSVGAYIRSKVNWLAKRNRYNDKTRDAVKHYLSLNAKDTFLWVSLVCQELTYISGWKAQKKLTAFPPGLDALYRRMMDQIHNSEDANLCERILAVFSTVYRPVTLNELVSLVDMPNGVPGSYEALSEVIELCGSFLTLRERTVFFVHQSAKDFLSQEASSELFPYGMEDVHYSIFSKSLQIMSTLRRDMYSLHELGYPASLVEPPEPDPLATLCYSCIYWIAHLCDSSIASAATSSVDLQDSGAIYKFLREKFLYWLEALSLCKSLLDGVVSIAKLKALADGRSDAAMLNKLVQDAHRFIMAHKEAIENSPLQAYASALLFSPTSSLVRGYFKEEEPQWITIKPSNVTGDQWSACLLTLEGHRGAVNSVAFSHDSTRLVSASYDKLVKIWDLSSSTCLLTLKGHSAAVRSVAFSYDSAWLASASYDKLVKIWDPSSGTCLSTLEGYHSRVWTMTFSYDSTRLASASDNAIKIWHLSSGTCLLTLEGHSDTVCSVAFSYDSARLASASGDRTVRTWDLSSGACLLTFKGHSGTVWSIAFSHDLARLASASGDNAVKIWDPSSGTCLSTLEGHRDWVRSVAFSCDSTRLASASNDKTVKIWDPSSGVCLSTLNVGWKLNRISFNHTNSYIYTEIGTISLRIPLDSIVPLTNAEVQQPQYKGIALSSDGVWITYNSKKFIWLPSEYRPYCSAVSDNTISVGVGSGRVWFVSTF